MSDQQPTIKTFENAKADEPTFLDMFNLLADSAPARLREHENRQVLTPSIEMYEFTSRIPLNEDGSVVREERAGITTPVLTLVEARYVQQLKNGTENDWMGVLELSVAAPGARTWIWNKDTEAFELSPVYAKLPLFAEQTPMFYAQHMRVHEGEAQRLNEFLRGADPGWSAPEIGMRDPAQRRETSDRRKDVWHLSAPFTANTYSTQIAQKLKTGIPVSSLTIQCREQGSEYDGFEDPVSAQFKAFRLMMIDGDSKDKDIKAAAGKLAHSLGGITKWQRPEDKGTDKWMKSPVRVAVPELTLDEEPFSFWLQRPDAPAGSEAVTIQPSDAEALSSVIGETK